MFWTQTGPTGPGPAGARALGLVHPDLLVLQVLLSEDLSVTRFSACSQPGMPAGAPGPAQGNRKGENLTRVEGVRQHLWGGGNADRVLALLPLDQNLMRLRISGGVLVPRQLVQTFSSLQAIWNSRLQLR